MMAVKNHRFSWFILLAAAYCLGYGGLLWYSDFLPYVLDNNETFSSIVHAANLYHFGIEKTFGLTDEAYGMSAAAHPYVYTHQGNFPRLYALLLYALGARSPEAQIVITTFTIGFAGIYFAYRFVSQLTSEIFAVVFCLLMMSDYLMFAQWQVNTWQVWHLFFFFSSLLCIRGLGSSRALTWTPLSVLNFSCLFYYEILFSVFVLTFCGLYAIYLHHKRLRTAFSTIFIMGAGAGLGATVLVAQNIAYFGLDKFLEDLRLTYLGRNMAGSSRDLLQKLGEFYDQNNIVFWHNITDAGYLRSPPEMARHFINFVLAPYTPYLVFAALAIALSHMFASMRRPGADAMQVSADGPNRPSDVGLALLGAAFATFAGSVLIDSRIAGINFEANDGLSLGIRAVILAVVSVFAVIGYHRMLNPCRDLRGFNITRAVVYLLVVSALVRTQAFWYDPIYQMLWDETVVFSGSVLILQVAAIGTVWVAARHVLMGGQCVTTTLPPVALQGLFLCVAFGLVAFAASAALIPGYLKTVYLARHAPLTVFFHILPMALLFYTLGAYARRDFTLSLDPNGNRRRRYGMFGLVSAGALVFMIFYWCQLQVTYMTRLPPDHFAFIKNLRSPPFRGASFAVNTYAAPVAASTGGWAYFDPVLSSGFVEMTEHGPRMARDMKLLWLADKRTNPDYRKPDYFLCIRTQYFRSQYLYSAGLWGPYGNENPPPDGCSRLPLVAMSQDVKIPGSDNEVVAWDRSGRDRWAIVRLRSESQILPSRAEGQSE